MNLFRSTAIDFLRWITDVAGGVMLSNRAYDHLLSQRARAVAELVKYENAGSGRGLVGVVFSHDRALQLYALLHTYFGLVEHPVPLFILYKARTGPHAKAYKEVEMACDNTPAKIIFVPETLTFRESILDVLNRIATRNMFFLVDDIIFIRPVNFESIKDIDPTATILSLRHSPHLRRSYTARKEQSPPSFSSTEIEPELLLFNWFEQGNEWSDPWSVDGQILSTAEVRARTRLSDFRAPNSYEGALKTYNDIAKGRHGMCFRESKILNLPINRVQSETANHSGTISPEFLLGQWNTGMMLDTGMFRTYVPESPHERTSSQIYETHESPTIITATDIPLQQNGCMKSKLVIVGAGIGGCFLADSLAESCDVSIVEIGAQSPDFLQQRVKDLGKAAITYPHIGSGLGGTTAFWHNGLIEVDEDVFKHKWPFPSPSLINIMLGHIRSLPVCRKLSLRSKLKRYAENTWP